MKLLLTLWHDETGFILTAELVLVMTVLVIGVLVGLTALRDSLIGELSGVANSLSRLNQSYAIPGVVGRNGSFTAGSSFVDTLPPLVGQVQAVETQERCVQVCGGLP